MDWDFQIVQVTAAGTFGTVCVAFDWRSRQFYALKVLKERFRTHGQVLDRSRDEAAMLAAMNHPNILRVHEVFDVDERPIIVMEWIQGCSLQDLIDTRTGGLPATTALEIVRQACVALDAAFRTPSPGNQRPMEIIHRDLKPSNMLLTLRGVVKVVDFGIARAIFEGKKSETVSMVLGARDYMAPERLDGQEETQRLDVYAMGLILYELLQGEHLTLSLRPRVHARQKEDALDALALVDCPPGLAPAIRALFGDMTAYAVEDRLDVRDVITRIEELLATAGAPDMSRFANHTIRPVFEANSLMDPRLHDDYDELRFIDAMGPTPPGGDPDIDARLREFLDHRGWERRVEELWTLLLLNPSWTARPFLEWLDRRRAQWWQFWQQNAATVPQKIALLRILACRFDKPVRMRVKRFQVDPDARVRRLATALLTAEEITHF